MSGFPKAKSGAAAHPETGELDSQTAAILRLADGATSVEAMALALAISREQVWAGLDRLYDWGLLAARLTPPAAAPLSRRGVLGTAARGAGWLGVAGAAMATPAFAAGEQSAEQAVKRGHQATETHEKSMVAKESAKKHEDRAVEQEHKRSNQGIEAAQESKKKREERASEERKKHTEQAIEQKEKRSGPLGADEKLRIEHAEEQKFKRESHPQ